MEYVIYLALVVVTAIVVKIVLDRRSTIGTLKIDHSDPERDRYLFDLGNNLDKLSKKGFKKLVTDKTVRFSSLQYLVVNPVETTITPNGEDELNISLNNYVLLSPDNIPLDDKDKESLQQVMEQDPLSLVEYWSIDPDYDGETFRSTWQDYRENVDNDSDPFHCVYSTRITMPHKDERKVCVKAVDVFGFESQVVLDVKS